MLDAHQDIILKRVYTVLKMILVAFLITKMEIVNYAQEGIC